MRPTESRGGASSWVKGKLGGSRKGVGAHLGSARTGKPQCQRWVGGGWGPNYYFEGVLSFLEPSFKARVALRHGPSPAQDPMGENHCFRPHQRWTKFILCGYVGVWAESVTSLQTATGAAQLKFLTRPDLTLSWCRRVGMGLMACFSHAIW